MKVFVTGATGFIGGSVAVRLIEEGHEVSGLVRTREKGEALAGIGVEPVLGSLDDAHVLTASAKAADAVINAASSDHRGAVDVLIDALDGSDKVLLHTSGSSIVGDDSRGAASERVYTEPDVLGGWEPAPDKAARVALDRAVLAAAERGVRSAVLCNTLIYGHGRGLSRDSVQIPRLVAQARKSGVVRHVGAGRNIWSNAHIDDVADAYLKALDAVPAGTFHFIENGEASFLDVTGAIADALELGPPQPWDVDSAIAEWGYEPAVFALGSNSRVRGTAREALGWSPRHGSVTDWIRSGLNDSG